MLTAPHTISVAYNITSTQSTDRNAERASYLVFLNSTVQNSI